MEQGHELGWGSPNGKGRVAKGLQETDLTDKVGCM